MLPGVILVLLPLVVFPGPALLRTVFFQHDIQYYSFPQHVLAGSLLRQGQLPLWNRYSCCGLPLLGDAQIALLYPPNWLFLFLPGYAAYTYVTLLQFSIVGLGTYLYARSLQLGEMPAFVGAIAFMLGGFMTARVVHLPVLCGAALLPWVLLAVGNVLAAPTRRRFVVAAGFVAMQTCCGHPQMVCYSGLAVFVLAITLMVKRWRESANAARIVGIPLTLGGVYLLGIAVAALQLVPFVEAISFSPRAAGVTYEFVTAHSIEGAQWLLFLFPYMFGSFQPGIYTPVPSGGEWLIILVERLGYVGILPLALALVALVDGLGRWIAPKPNKRGKKPRMPGDPNTPGPSHQTHVLFFAALLMFGILLASGNQTPFGRLFFYVPLLGRLRDVERAVVLISFAACGLAMIALQRIVDERVSTSAAATEKWSLRAGLGAGAIVALMPLGLVLAMLIPDAPQWLDLNPVVADAISWRHANGFLAVLAGLCSAALLVYWMWKPAAGFSSAIAVGVVVLDMIAFASGFNPTIDRAEFVKRPAVLQSFARETQPFRKLSLLRDNPLDVQMSKEMLAMGWSQVFGVEDIEGMNPLQPKTYLDYLYWPRPATDVSYGMFQDGNLLFSRSPILDSLNVKYLIAAHGVLPPPPAGSRDSQRIRLAYSSEQVDVFENLHAFPRAFFVNVARAMTDRAAILDKVESARLNTFTGKPEGFDLRHNAIVESDHFPPLLDLADSEPGTATVSAVSADSIEVHTRCNATRLLILSEPCYPGWHGSIDGRESEIFRSNFLFRGVVVPAGEHIVSFDYRPRSVQVGAMVSLIAILVCGGLLVSSRKSTA
jgi:hypothetical protein